MISKINIALICTSLNQIGGKNVHFKNMYVNLNNEKLAITIILSSSLEKEHKAYLLQEGVKAEDVVFIPRYKKWLIVPFIMELYKILKKRKINIVHTFQIQSDIFGFMAVYMGGAAYLISQQESKVIEESLSVFKNLFYRLLNIFIRDFFKKTVVVSEGLRKELIAERLRPKQKIEVIPLGIAIPEEYKECDFNFVGLQERKPLIGTIARLNKEKGIERFISAMPFILRKIPMARFLIVGKGYEKANLEAQVKSLNLDSKVDFQEVPWSESVYKVLASLDIFVMPSLREGCPTSLLEALAFSRPVVASKIPGISDIVEDGRNGLMVDTSDPQLFAENIIFLCEQPDTAVAMGKEGRKKILSSFTLEREMERFRKLYQDTLASYYG